MGVGFVLVNHSRREKVTLAQLPASTANKLAGNAVTAAMTTWYLLQHREEQVAVVFDSLDDWPFPSGGRSDLHSYPDVTDRIVDELIAVKILRDDGVSWADPDDPTVRERAIRNVWMQP